MKDFKDLEEKTNLIMNKKSNEINEIRNILVDIVEYEEKYLLNLEQEFIKTVKKLKEKLELKNINNINQEEFDLAIKKNTQDYYDKQVKEKIKNAAPKGLYERLERYYDNNNEVNVNVGGFNLKFEINLDYLVTIYTERLSYLKESLDQIFKISINKNNETKEILSLEITANNKNSNGEELYMIIIMSDNNLTINNFCDSTKNIELDKRYYKKSDIEVLNLITFDSILNLAPIELENIILLTTDRKIKLSNNSLYSLVKNELNEFIETLETTNKIDKRMTINKKG